MNGIAVSSHYFDWLVIGRVVAAISTNNRSDLMTKVVCVCVCVASARGFDCIDQGRSQAMNRIDALMYSTLYGCAVHTCMSSAFANGQTIADVLVLFGNMNAAPTPERCERIQWHRCVSSHTSIYLSDIDVSKYLCIGISYNIDPSIANPHVRSHSN